MKDMFFIQDCGSGWFNLVVKSNLYTMSTGSLEDMVHCLRKIVHRYKSEQGLLKRLSKMEYSTRIGASERAMRESYLSANGEDYAGLVKETVEQALKELRENTAYKQVKTLLSKRKNHALVTHSAPPLVQEVVQEEVKAVKVVRPKVLIRR